VAVIAAAVRADHHAPGASADRGMSMVELLVALAVAGAGLSTLALLTPPVLAAFAADPAAAELHQRGRVSMVALVDEIAHAGAGFVGAAALAPGASLPALVPDQMRGGAWAVTPRPSTLSVLAADRSAAHAALDQAAAAGETRLVLRRPGYCAALSPTCRFTAGDDVLLMDVHGRFALASVRVASPPLVLDLTSPLADAWPVGTRVSVIAAHRYALRDDPDTGLQQLTRAVGTGPASPFVDFVQRFDVEWLVAAAGPVVRLAPDGTEEGTSFGPAPPPVGQVGDPAWPAGENCAFGRDAAGRAIARGAAPPAGVDGVALASLGDGPWCPSPSAPTRWDADLARVVGVRVRLELAVAAAVLRPPMTALAGPGVAQSRPVPPLRLTAVVAPGRAGSPR
jgi:prepilin-type N-terminal cleavage/methylation domain-containing protein